MSILPALGQDQAGLGGAKGLAQDLLLFPLRYMKGVIDQNRQTALTSSAALSQTAFRTGESTQNLMTQLSRFPGSIQGQVSDQLSFFQNAPGYGGMYSFGMGANAPRTAGLMAGVREAQMLNPMETVPNLLGTIGGFASNTRAQQQSQMLTGGAFGMIKPGGGGQKSLSEWAESVLRWLEGLRSGGDRGKPFDYGQLIAQYFPGSNIDAWFDASGVPQDMREYWWTYALGKAKSVGSTQGEFQIKPEEASVSWQRLKSASMVARNEFTLAGTLSGAYANREQANRWMNDVMGKFQQSVIPAAISSGPLNFMQFMPDIVEQVLMQLLERSGTAGMAVGAYLGYPGFLDILGGDSDYGGFDQSTQQALQDRSSINSGLMGVDLPFGDVDIGDVGIGDQYSTTGGTGTAGLHPDMRRRVNKMMQANPRLRINSGLRDTMTQRTLKSKGVGKVSGKPGAHTQGMAADLGPASQYNWLTKNAGKFGLKSGVGKGEPWHVGMGDIGDTEEDLFGMLSGGAFDIFSGFKKLATGGGGDESLGGMGQIITSLFNLLGGVITGEGRTLDPSKLAFMPDLIGKLNKYSKGIQLGGSVTIPDAFLRRAQMSRIPGVGAMLPPLQSGGTAAGGSGSVGITPAEEMVAFNSTDLYTRGVAVVKALYRAGFRGDQLNKMASISFGESTWNYRGWADASTGDTNDIGGGLFGINVKPYVDKGKPWPWSREEIQDPWRSAEIAYNDFFVGRGYDPWTTRNRSQVEGNRAVQMAGLGDAEYEAMLTPTGPTSSSGKVTVNQFTNHFNIGGSTGGGGIDVRRTVTMIADHLEDEMKTRAARSN